MARTKPKKKPSPGEGGRPVAENRKSRFLYSFEETFEAGVMLIGTEVKAIREGGANLTDSYVRTQNGEAWLLGCHIAPYSSAGVESNHEPLRERKLLLHRKEIDKMATAASAKGLTLVVPKLYLKNGRVKAEVAIARGKKTHDKRAVVKDRMLKKEADRAMKRHR